MHVITRKTLRAYGEAHAQVREELNTLYAIWKAAGWVDFNALRNDFPSADYIGDNRYVFNVKGNHFRVVVMIFFESQQLFIRGIFTHGEYSKLSKKQLATL